MRARREKHSSRSRYSSAQFIITLAVGGVLERQEGWHAVARCPARLPSCLSNAPPAVNVWYITLLLITMYVLILSNLWFRVLLLQFRCRCTGHTPLQWASRLDCPSRPCSRLSSRAIIAASSLGSENPHPSRFSRSSLVNSLALRGHLDLAFIGWLWASPQGIACHSNSRNRSSNMYIVNGPLDGTAPISQGDGN